LGIRRNRSRIGIGIATGGSEDTVDGPRMEWRVRIDRDPAAIGGPTRAIEHGGQEGRVMLSQQLAKGGTGGGPQGGAVEEDWNGSWGHGVNIPSQGVLRQRLAACGRAPVGVFVLPNMSSSPVEVLLAVSEPTRLRILNCLAAAPLFVSDLQTILELPQPTVSRHLAVLRQHNVVRDTPIGQYVLYRLRREAGPTGRLVLAVLDAVRTDAALRSERSRAIDRSRSHTSQRLALAES
jgi:ArsR family transcriptional regulator